MVLILSGHAIEDRRELAECEDFRVMGSYDSSQVIPCQDGYRRPTRNEAAQAIFCRDDIITPTTTMPFQDCVVLEEPSGCGCQWDGMYCTLPSVETSCGRSCGNQMHWVVCVRQMTAPRERCPETVLVDIPASPAWYMATLVAGPYDGHEYTCTPKLDKHNASWDTDDVIQIKTVSSRFLDVRRIDQQVGWTMAFQVRCCKTKGPYKTLDPCTGFQGGSLNGDAICNTNDIAGGDRRIDTACPKAIDGNRWASESQVEFTESMVVSFPEPRFVQTVIVSQIGQYGKYDKHHDTLENWMQLDLILYVSQDSDDGCANELDQTKCGLEEYCMWNGYFGSCMAIWTAVKQGGIYFNTAIDIYKHNVKEVKLTMNEVPGFPIGTTVIKHGAIRISELSICGITNDCKTITDVATKATCLTDAWYGEFEKKRPGSRWRKTYNCKPAAVADDSGRPWEKGSGVHFKRKLTLDFSHDPQLVTSFKIVQVGNFHYSKGPYNFVTTNLELVVELVTGAPLILNSGQFSEITVIKMPNGPDTVKKLTLRVVHGTEARVDGYQEHWVRLLEIDVMGCEDTNMTPQQMHERPMVAAIDTADPCAGNYNIIDLKADNAVCYRNNHFHKRDHPSFGTNDFFKENLVCPGIYDGDDGLDPLLGFNKDTSPHFTDWLVADFDTRYYISEITVTQAPGIYMNPNLHLTMGIDRDGGDGFNGAANMKQGGFTTTTVIDVTGSLAYSPVRSIEIRKLHGTGDLNENWIRLTEIQIKGCEVERKFDYVRIKIIVDNFACTSQEPFASQMRTQWGVPFVEVMNCEDIPMQTKSELDFRIGCRGYNCDDATTFLADFNTWNDMSAATGYTKDSTITTDTVLADLS